MPLAEGDGARIIFERLAEDVRVPARATEQSAGYDIRAYLTGSPVRVFRGDSAAPVTIPPTHPAAPSAVAVQANGSPDTSAASPAEARANDSPADPANRPPAANGSVDTSGETPADVPYIVLQPGDRALVPTGFRSRLPDGFEAQIRMRSSLAWKRGLTVPNAPGTVDADYPDEWFVLVLNAAPHPIRIGHGERIAQVVLHRYEVAAWEEGPVAVSTDRTGGLGSTGTE